MSFMALAVCEKNWLEAVAEGKKFVETRTDAVNTLLPFMSEVEQCQYLKSETAWTFPLALAKLRPDDLSVVEATAEWVLNGKAVTLELLTERVRLARGEAGKRVQELMDEVAGLNARLSKYTSGRTFHQATRDEIKGLTDQRADKEKELVKLLYKNTRQRKWIALADVQKKLPAGSALVEVVAAHDRDYATGKQGVERYFAWVIRPNSVAFVDLGACEPTDAAVAAVRTDMESAEKNIERNGVAAALKDTRDKLRALSERTVHKLAPHLTGVTALTVCPSEGLWLAPWAVLLTKDGKYLVEEYAVSSVVAGRDLLESPTDPAAKLGPAAVFGNPDYDMALTGTGRATGNAYLDTASSRGVAVRSQKRGQGGFGELRGTAKEVDGIRKSVSKYAGGDPKEYVREAATEEAFKRLVRPRAVVLCTHGFFDPPTDPPKRPDPPEKVAKTEAYLDVIAPPGSKIEVDGREPADGRLHLNELTAGQKVKKKLTVTYPAEGSNREVELLAGTIGYTFFSAAERVTLAAHLEHPLLRCGLALAGANNAKGAASADDGILTGLEIVGTDLRGTQVVWLSACETGVQDRRAGESVAGLRQAFQLAGARAVVSTLWKIPDDETADLSAKFWAELAGGKTPTDALAVAQRKVLQAGGPTAHPYYWAAFNVTVR